MNNTNDLYNRWLAQPDLDDAVKAELVSIAGDSDAVTDRFYRDLEVGTGGRGRTAHRYGGCHGRWLPFWAGRTH